MRLDREREPRGCRVCREVSYRNVFRLHFLSVRPDENLSSGGRSPVLRNLSGQLWILKSWPTLGRIEFPCLMQTTERATLQPSNGADKLFDFGGDVGLIRYGGDRILLDNVQKLVGRETFDACNPKISIYVLQTWNLHFEQDASSCAKIHRKVNNRTGGVMEGWRNWSREKTRKPNSNFSMKFLKNSRFLRTHVQNCILFPLLVPKTNSTFTGFIFTRG